MAKYENRLQVSVSNKLHSRLRDRAEYLGASLPEYVRYVLMKEMEKGELENNSEYIQLAKESLEDSRKGKLKEFPNVDEALKYLDAYVRSDE
jgi:Arc/MetJ-type ribon-helix-helix transcriptional regulator